MFIARFINDTNIIQSVQEHNTHVGEFASRSCDLPFLKTTCLLLGLLHDSGKYQDCFQNYIQKAMTKPDNPRGNKVDHSFAGGWIVTDLADQQKKTDRFLMEMVRHAILCHHGLKDCINPTRSTFEIYYNKRLHSKDFPMKEICDEVYKNVSRTKLEGLFQKSKEEFNEFLKRVKETVAGEEGEKKKTLKNFYFGLIERLLLSFLIDADRTDAACFVNQTSPPSPQTTNELRLFWESLCERLNETLSQFPSESRLDTCRAEISEQCYRASESQDQLYRLVVPTGGGKTLSSFRFAVNHARLKNKRRVFYIAPFNSILEQNAGIIRVLLSDFVANDVFLEHHSSVILKDEEEEEKYQLLAENWDVPLVATSAVQFLETLFSSGSGSIRRMRALVNAVIVVDEVQSIPLKCQSLFNLAVNFLTEFCDTTIVLCSATQPPLDVLPRNRMKPPKQMITNSGRFLSVFKRTQIIDVTQPGGYKINELARFAVDRLNELGDSANALIIVNTKDAAKKLYEELKNQNTNLDHSKPIHLFHLSTNMCPRHRKEVFNQLKQCQNDQNRVICVSTQLIEAGVDISFRMVIRSLAGLDNIIQAAGRCNRNAEESCGKVYIINLDANEEKVSLLREIIRGQKETQAVLDSFKRCPNQFQNDLLSQKAMEDYYARYYSLREDELDYRVCSCDSNMIELLSTNTADVRNGLSRNGNSLFFCQAFKTAGDAFNVIEDDYVCHVLVEYAKCMDIIDQLHISVGFNRKKQLLRCLQAYTVGIPEWLYNKIDRREGLIRLEDLGIIIVKKEYYSSETGVFDTFPECG